MKLMLWALLLDSEDIAPLVRQVLEVSSHVLCVVVPCLLGCMEG